LTALVLNPRLVILPIRLVVEVRRPEIPTPTGPSKTAINLDRITEITILKT
jgi:hypothetical protein